jgi:formylglycine-generating enzyme required for sulfatase activity
MSDRPQLVRIVAGVLLDDGFKFTSPVGSFPANAFGLYGMGGNPWQ